MEIHEKYMRRCIELAENGLGTTYPNPLVGSVIVHKDKIIGEGWHRIAGKPHAEVNAIAAVKDKSLLRDATLYVNLEPCSHFGKTPPCSDLIVSLKIPHVVIGTTDPNNIVSGNGIKKLFTQGTMVTTDILADECRALNRRFFTYHEKKRPYVILKWAETADGYIAPQSRNATAPVWISNKFSRQLVHKWRTEEQAILVGTQTVIDDNPRLTARDWHGKKPIRIILDKNSRIPKDSHIFDNQSETLVFCDSPNIENPSATLIDFNKDVLAQILETLHQRNINSLIVEGGRQTLQAFIDCGRWDEARVIRGNATFGGGTKAPVLRGRLWRKENLLDDELLFFRND